MLCPCCSQDVAATPPSVLTALLKLTPYERRVLEQLVAAFGRWVERERLITRLYEDRVDGGPLNALNGLAVLFVRLRKKLAGLGFRIETLSGGSSGRSAWRLVWEASGAPATRCTT